MTLILMSAKRCSAFRVTGIVDGVLFHLSNDKMKTKMKILKENSTHEELASLLTVSDSCSQAPTVRK